MDAHVTFAKLALFRKCKLDGNGSTTLVVVDIDTLRGAESDLATRGPICQLILDKDIGGPGS